MTKLEGSLSIIFALMYDLKINFFLDKVILFVSDGRPTDSEDDIHRVISQQNAKLKNEVIIQTFGVGVPEGKCSVCDNIDYYNNRLREALLNFRINW